ncbi:MAG: hypothetical protein GEU96_07990 [Propionibacteriales bacterium]|nr:hypothetical protein [Propionibacteriales bacterium]
MDRTRPVYDAIAEVYALLDDPTTTSTRPDVEFFSAFANEQPRPVVELGIGGGRVGRHARPDIGVDQSPELLAVATARCAGLTPVLGDLTDFRLPEPAATAYAAGNCFETTEDDEQLRAMFAGIRKNVALGGLFAFDSHVPPNERLAESFQRTRVAAATADRVVTEAVLPDPDHSFRQIYCLEKLGADGVVESRHYLPPLRVRLLDPDVVIASLEATGWEVESAFRGGFPGHPPVPGQNVYVARAVMTA